MPITWRLMRDHYGPPYSSDTRWVAVSGHLEIGVVTPQVLSDNRSIFVWFAHFDPNYSSGRASTAEEAKAALEQLWFDWIKRAGLKDDPDAQPMGPPMAGQRRPTSRG